MDNLRKKMLRTCCILASLLLLVSWNLVAMCAENDAAVKEQEVHLTIHEYDWTSYSMDHENAQPGEGTGERNTELEENWNKYALEHVELKVIRISNSWSAQDPVNGSILTEPRYQISDFWKEQIFTGNDEMMARTEFTSEELVQAIEKRKNEIESMVAVNEDIPDTTLIATDENGEAALTIPKSEQGMYLVVESKVPENVEVTTAPFLISLPMEKADRTGWNYDIHVYPKNQTCIPTVKKLVSNGNERYEDSTSVSSGDKINYNLVANIPNATTDATKFQQFDFEDRLPVGIECETTVDANGNVILKNPEDVNVSIYKNRQDAEQKKGTDYEKLIYGIDYTLEYIKVDDGNSVLRVKLTEEGLRKLNAHANGTEYISVSYPAIVGDVTEITMGDEGNRSDVSLHYGRTSTTNQEGTVVSTQVIKDAAVVLTYGMEIQKKFDIALSNAELVEQVQFILYNKEKKKYIIATLQTDEKTGAQLYGSYKVIGSTEKEEEATRFSPNVEGQIVVDGLSANTYEMTEIKTVSGYALLKEPVVIQIFAKEVVTQPTTASLAGQEQENSQVVVTDVYGKEKATALVNGKAAEVTTEGRVPRVRLSILNKKISKLEATITSAVSKLEDLLHHPSLKEETNPPGNTSSSSTSTAAKTADTTQLWPSILALAGSAFLLLRYRKKRR